VLVVSLWVYICMFFVRECSVVESVCVQIYSSERKKFLSSHWEKIIFFYSLSQCVRDAVVKDVKADDGLGSYSRSPLSSSPQSSESWLRSGL